MESKKINKIGEIVKLQRILKKCRKIADSFENNSSSGNNNTSTISKGSNKRIKFLKRTFSFTDSSSINGVPKSGTVRKGYVAVCVGKDIKRFIIPTEYLCHKAFEILLREAEDEFGFQQEGVLRLPCEECVFEDTLKVIQKKSTTLLVEEPRNSEANPNRRRSCSIESQLSWSPHTRIQPCR
uniref:Auxin-induced protein 6B n=1 Tax=Sedum alfredii TaxID=439688 RepID=A0A650AVI4_9MAGN|nr:Auxin-induced protein 6B [Sedum alfredii]